jgi:2-dehydro-3-deoxyphosphogluconate aldolase/(4S)-4-hydroxy-2-oxoglutarate aldolase
MDKTALYQKIKDAGIVAIIRGQKPELTAPICDSLLSGGVRAVEVTLNTSGALEMITWLAANYGKEMMIGAGTVLDGPSARVAILAGASFVLTPALNPETVTMCHRYGIPIFPGAMTPTEVLTAWELGVAAVKVFPAGRLGPSYFSDLHGPLPQADLMAVGGVTVENAGQFIKAGAVALGVGGELVSRALVEAGDMKGIEQRARAFVEAVREARSLAA